MTVIACLKFGHLGTGSLKSKDALVVEATGAFSFCQPLVVMTFLQCAGVNLTHVFGQVLKKQECNPE